MSVPNIIQVVGYKNSGKTTLICRFIEELNERGVRSAVIKHDAHGFEMDRPGTDTYQFSVAGAEAVSITSEVTNQTAIIVNQSSTLEKMIERCPQTDIIFVEGFKSADFPKIVVMKHPSDRVLVDQCTHVIAVATWGMVHLDDMELPVFNLSDVDSLLAFALNSI